MKFSTKIKMFALTALLSVSLIACDNGSGVIQDVQNDVNTVVYYAEETVNVGTAMVENTVVNGCGAFNPCN